MQDKIYNKVKPNKAIKVLEVGQSKLDMIHFCDFDVKASCPFFSLLKVTYNNRVSNQRS